MPYQKKNWNPLELDENMQLSNSSIVLKTCIPESLTRPTFSFDGLCTFKECMSDSVTNYNYVGDTKISVSIKTTYANKCKLSEIFLTEILKSFSAF